MKTEDVSLHDNDDYADSDFNDSDLQEQGMMFLIILLNKTLINVGTFNANRLTNICMLVVTISNSASLTIECLQFAKPAQRSKSYHQSVVDLMSPSHDMRYPAEQTEVLFIIM